MIKYKVCYVILHYKTWEDTIECINSLQKVMDESDSIIIVDNGSGDGSDKKILDRYTCDEHIVFLQAYYNLGFAKGNNIGYRYAKTIEKADVICMFNSDTIILEKNFRKLLLKSLNNNDWAVLGIDIEKLDGTHQNPLKFYPKNFEILKNLYHHLGKYIKLTMGQETQYAVKKQSQDNNMEYMQSFELTKSKSKYALHGAAIIFSKKYINLFNGLYPGTFMYCEEYILKYMCDRFDLKMYYDSSMKIIHKEGRSTATDYSQYREKELFYHKNCIKSYCCLFKLYFISKRKIQYIINDTENLNCSHKVL